MKDVVIIGAGIAGLSAAYELQKYGADIHVIESTDRIGGNIKSSVIDGTLIEEGPYTLTSSGKDVLDLAIELGLKDSLIEADNTSKKRFIYLNKKLIPAPMGLVELYKTDLLSSHGKKTLFEEILIPRVDKEETVEEFITRRFGVEVLKNLIQPFLSGVYAGDVKKLSANAVFPKLKELEAKFKSVLLGFPLSKGLNFKREKHTLYSFKNGIEELTNTLGKNLTNKITLNANQIEVTRAKDFFVVSFKVNNKLITYTTNAILFATPAYTLQSYPHLFPSKDFMEIFNIEYFPIATVAQNIEKSKIKSNLDGFGFLCTKEPRRKLLGTIFTSSIFPSRYKNNKAVLNSFIGGAYYPRIVSQTPEEIEEIVSKEVAEILNIEKTETLNTINIKVYPKAIPQYYLGHREKVLKLEEIMDRDFGLFFTGNYLYGISINDTVKTSKKIVERVKKFLKAQKIKTSSEQKDKISGMELEYKAL